MNFATKILTLAALGAGIFSAQAAEGNQPSSIRAVIASYETALNNSDAETILGLYGSDPVFMPQNASAIIGRAAVRAGYKHVFETIKLKIRFEVYEVQQAGDWAWARTSSAGAQRMLASGAETAEGNNELFVFHRENGVWKIHRYLFATNQPHE